MHGAEAAALRGISCLCWSLQALSRSSLPSSAGQELPRLLMSERAQPSAGRYVYSVPTTHVNKSAALTWPYFLISNLLS